MLQKKIIEHYSFSLTDSIGKGFSSVVYKGKNDRTNESIAIKVIELKMLEQDQIYKDLLKSQIEILLALQNIPNILHLYNTYTTKNNTYLMTQLCQTDLMKIIKQRKRFSLADASLIIEQILAGYLEIHKAGYIHRDIKPANIFYKTKKYKLADFGFAVKLEDLPNHQKYNVGSPMYMSPEALKQNKYSFSSDIWAIAVILFELLKGFTPWKARSEQALYQKLINQPIQNQLFDIPEECKTFIRRALSIDVKQRLSVEDIRQWIETFQRLGGLLPENSAREYIKQIVPLRQINLTSLNKNHKEELSMKKQNSPFRQIQNMPKLSVMQTPKSKQFIIHHQMQKEQGAVDSKLKSYLNFCKFIYKLLKFLSTPAKFSFKSLKDIQLHLTKILSGRINQIRDQMESGNNYLQIEGWYDYWIANHHETIKKVVQKYYKKYTIIFPVLQSLPADNIQQLISTSIHQTLEHLAEPCNYDEKSIIIMDYLTTLYQLFDIEKKYDWNHFGKISKIDLIVEGSPYNISLDHLNKLRNKITIIGI